MTRNDGRGKVTHNPRIGLQSGFNGRMGGYFARTDGTGIVGPYSTRGEAVFTAYTVHVAICGGPEGTVIDARDIDVHTGHRYSP